MNYTKHCIQVLFQWSKVNIEKGILRTAFLYKAQEMYASSLKEKTCFVNSVQNFIHDNVYEQEMVNKPN